MKIITTIFASILLMSNACSQIEKTTDRSDKSVYKIEDYIQGKSYDGLQVATVAGGCFWCTEAAFEQLVGVVDLISGYIDGHVDYPSYQAVCTGSTGHTEAIQIYFDPQQISFEKLLDVFWVAHDPTTLNRQGPDIGTQYRSGIYFHNDEQKKSAKQSIKDLNASGKYDDRVVTEVKKYSQFWVAEGYHQDYYWHTPENPYVQRVSKPKVEKVKKEFKDIIKKDFVK